MAEGRIEFQKGDISFIGEGNEDWLSEQLDKIIETFGDTTYVTSSNSAEFDEPERAKNDLTETSTDKNIYDVNLSIFLRNHNATSNQRLKFLAAAAWLARNTENHLKTIEVTKALKESRQPSLSNPADCLNKNVSQGYCEKDNDHFFVTPHGFDQFENDEER